MSEAILRTKLTADTAELQRGLREAAQAGREFASEMSRQIKETAVEIAGLVLGVESVKEAIEKTFEGVKGVFDLSRDLRNLSNQTGASVRDLVQLRAEFDLSGIAADNVGGILNRMQRSIEQAADKGGPMADMFYRLGLNIYDLQTMNPAAQFDLLRERLTAIEDPARRAQIAMKLFGNFGGGGSVLSIFGNSKIATEAADAIHQQSDILARNAQTFQEVSINLEEAGIRIEGFFVGMAEPISRVLLPVLQELNSLDLTKWGSEIGDGITGGVRALYNMFKEGGLATEAQELMSALVQGFGAGFKDVLVGAADSFIGEMMKLIAPFTDAMVAGMNTVVDDFQKGVYVALSKIPGMEHHYDAGIAQILANAPERETEAGVKAQRIRDWLNTVEPAINAQTQKELAALNSMPAGKVRFDARQRIMDENAAAKADLMRRGPTGQIGGATADQFQAVGGFLFGKGMSEIGKSMRDAIASIMAKYGAPIPGEGAPNAPAKGKQGPIMPEDMGLGRGQNISGIHFGEGGWHAAYDFASGPLNIEGGSATRAGRIVDSPEQKTEKNTEKIATNTDNIVKAMEGFLGVH